MLLGYQSGPGMTILFMHDLSLYWPTCSPQVTWTVAVIQFNKHNRSTEHNMATLINNNRTNAVSVNNGFLNFTFCWLCISIHLYNETNLVYYFSSVYFVNQRLHVSGIFVAHHQDVHCIYTTTVGWVEMELSSISTQPTDCQLKSTTRTSCCIYTVYLLMIGYKYAQNMQRLIDKINWG
jgi:hypothetical protein